MVTSLLHPYGPVDGSNYGTPEAGSRKDVPVSTDTSQVKFSPAAHKQEVDAAVDAAYLADGFITTDGERDTEAVVARIYQAVRTARVTNYQERGIKAITKGDLVATTFPSLPGREDWGDQPDPELAEEVHAKIDRAFGSPWMKLDANGPVQRLIADDDLLLCRTKIGNDGITAYYVTDDWKCIQEDYIKHFTKPIRDVQRKAGNALAMAGIRLPQYAKQIERKFSKEQKLGLEEGQLAIAPALNAVDDDE